MFKLLKEIHQHSLEVEDSMTSLPADVVSSKTIERTFGVMGSILLAGGCMVALAGMESELHRVSEFVAKQEASIIDVAKMGLVDPLLMMGGGLVGYAGLEDIAVANGIRRRRLQPDT